MRALTLTLVLLASAVASAAQDQSPLIVTVGTAVSISNTLVTGRNASGFFVQAKTGDPGYAGTDYSGVFVFQSGNTVKVGDRVTVQTATVTNFNGQIELTAPAPLPRFGARPVHVLRKRL